MLSQLPYTLSIGRYGSYVFITYVKARDVINIDLFEKFLIGVRNLINQIQVLH